MSSPPDWEVLQALFEKALRQPTADRAAFLRSQTDNEAIRLEVESLLAAHEQAGRFLEASSLTGGNDSRSDAPRFASGSRLGAFEILERLGAGGMGEVYRARDTRLDRFVAVKVLSPGLDMAVHGRQRFEREARAISKLSHPHICTVHDAGEARIDGRDIPFLVLELLDGETLAARLRRGRLPLDEAVAFAIDMADALAAAHRQGVVHRDLKPSNVMVTPSGVKLLDFGLAQLLAPARADDRSPIPRDASLTSAGIVIGTLPYTAPEQLDGRKADARSDIFSFGSVLYEMLTGRRAFPGDSGRSSAAEILSDDPRPVRQLEREIPAELENIVSRCLRKDPARRYQDIADVKVALDDVREELGAPSRRPAWPGKSRWPLAWISMLSMAAATIVAGYLAWSRRPVAETVRPSQVVPLTTLPGAELSPTLSPDGQSVAFVWSGPNRDNDDIYVQPIGGGGEVRRTTHPAHDFSPAWSPDGRWIAFLRGDVPGRSELFLVSPFGGPEVPLAEIEIRHPYAYPPYVAWFPDSAALVVVRTPPGKPTGLSVLSIATRELQPLTSPPAYPGLDLAPAVSPDGRLLAFKRGPELLVADIAGDGKSVMPPRLLAQFDVSAVTPAWMPDGKQIVYAAERTLFRVDVSGKTPAPVPFVGQDAIMPVVSRPAAGNSIRLVYVQMISDPNIWRLDLPAAGAATSATPAIFSPSTKIDANPQFSPDGRRVAFQSMRSGTREIWIADADGGNPTRLTWLGRGAAGSPRWSPDGELVAFDANVDGQWDIYTIAAGGGTPRRMTFEPVEDSIPSFSNDGKFLYFTSERTGTFEIWKTPVSGGNATQVTHDGGAVALESPGGLHLYYTKVRSGTSDLWRLATDDGVPERVLTGVATRAFQVLDHGIYYLERDTTAVVPGMGPLAGMDAFRSDTGARLQFFDFSDRKSRTLAHLKGPIALGLAVSGDGRKVLYTQVDDISSDLMMVENFR